MTNMVIVLNFLENIIEVNQKKWQFLKKKRLPFRHLALN
nr:MAG TPA: hypothetical protein [Caudoviricetes sp.]